MREMFLTKEGTLTESIKRVYLSKDGKYYHANNSIVAAYENFNIKDIDKLIPTTYNFKNKIFSFFDVNGFKGTILYKLSDSDIYLEFSFDSSFNKNSIQKLKPTFFRWDSYTELYIEIFDYNLENDLK